MFNSEWSDATALDTLTDSVPSIETTADVVSAVRRTPITFGICALSRKRRQYLFGIEDTLYRLVWYEEGRLEKVESIDPLTAAHKLQVVDTIVAVQRQWFQSAYDSDTE